MRCASDRGQVSKTLRKLTASIRMTPGGFLIASPTQGYGRVEVRSVLAPR
jgi:hypothetical protein